MININPTSHPDECAVCMDAGRICTWIVLESSVNSAHRCCDQCARRHLYCDWPQPPATDANGDILVDVPHSNPYVPGRPNETDAARRARVGSWNTKPDKPKNPKLYAKWREDLLIWNNRGNSPLQPTVPPRPPSTNPRAPPPPPKTPKQPPGFKEPSPPALDNFDHPTRVKTPPITIPETPPPFQPSSKPTTQTSSTSSNPVDIDPTPPAAHFSENYIEELIKKFGEEARLFWFCKKLALADEVALVGGVPTDLSTIHSTIAISESMYNMIVHHWSQHLPRSKKEADDRVDFLRKLKELVAHTLLFPSEHVTTTNSDASTSSSDKGKKRVFDQD
ncbi:hypothetical protein DFH28DRAFT_1151721 [Melampsora americana]|nr:hypothetical protein DFH28DRAFT_1151721 [Melampsora americana]